MPHLRRAGLLLAISMLLVYAVIGYRVRGEILNGSSDFLSAYTAGRILQRGEGRRLYDLQLQSEIQHAVAPALNSRAGALPFVRPPFEAWLFYPLAKFSYPVAFCIWSIAGLAFLTFSIVLLRGEVRLLASVPLYIAVIAALSFFPVFMVFVQGQDSILLLFAYAASFWALRRSRPLQAGAFLALGTFKFPLVLPFLVPFVVRGRWRFLAGFVIVTTGLATVSLATVGWAAMRGYPGFLMHIGQLAPGVNVPGDMTNLRGLTAVLLGSRSIRTVALAVSSLAVLAITSSNNPEGISKLATGSAFSLNMLGTILVSYHAHVFDLALLIIPLVLGADLVLSSRGPNLAYSRPLASSLALVAFSPWYLVFVYGLRTPAIVAVPVLLLWLVWTLQQWNSGEDRAIGSVDALAAE